MIIDGKAIAAELLADTKKMVESLPTSPRLIVITCSPNLETQKYLALKRRKAAAIGIAVEVVMVPEPTTTAAIVAMVEAAATQADGVIVQLPLPEGIEREVVLAAIPTEKDPDGFSYGTSAGACFPPVVGAIAEISRREGVVWKDAVVAVVGYGRLVGKPAAAFARTKGATVTVLTETSEDFAEVLGSADIIISGVGKPHFITSAQVKEGVLVFDAGASEDGGVVVGDVHPNVSTCARLFTPVPGGIGPVTVSLLLRNLVELIRQEKSLPKV